MSVSYDGNLLAAVNNKGRVYVWREEESLVSATRPSPRSSAQRVRHQVHLQPQWRVPGDGLGGPDGGTVAIRLESPVRLRSIAARSGPRDDDEERWTRIEDEDEDDGASYNSSFEGDSDMSLAEDRLLLRPPLKDT